MGPARTLSALLAAALALSSTAKAEAPESFGFRFLCAPSFVSESEVLGIVLAQLAPATLDGGEPHPAGAMDRAQVEIDACDEARASLRVNVTRATTRTQFEIALADVLPESRARTLALVVVEALEREPLAATSTSVEAPVPVPVPSQPEVAERPPPPPLVPRVEADGERLALRGGVTGRFVFGTESFCAGLDTSIAFGPLGVGLFALGTEAKTALGTLQLYAVGATVALDLWSPTAWLTARAATEVGLAFASGSPFENAAAQSDQAPHAALSLGLATALPRSSAFALELLIQGGYASSLIARSGGRDALGLHGPFIALTIAARVRDRSH